jgi:anti-anti-sigma factor
MYTICQGPYLETREWNGGTLTYAIPFTELRDAEAQWISEEMVRLARKRWSAALRLDFAGVEFVTAAALGSLVTLATQLREEGRRLVLTNLSATLRELVTVTRLDAVLDVRGR